MVQEDQDVMLYVVLHQSTQCAAWTLTADGNLNLSSVNAVYAIPTWP